MERLDVLIRQVRDQTGNQEYSSTQGIRQREMVRHMNAAQMRIYNKILQERSTLFVKKSYMDVVAGQAEYTLPTDVFLKHNLVKVDYSHNGDPINYSPLEFRTPRQEVSVRGFPSSYHLRDGTIVLSPIPSSSVANALRLNYQYSLPTLDVRRAQISRVESDGAPYEWTYTSTSASTLAGAYGAGLFVFGGSNGSIITSPDGVTWTARTSGFGSTTIRKIIYANSRFMAIGDSGKASTSTDGITWTALTLAGTPGTLRDIVYGDSRFVVVGDNGYCAVTADNGTTWYQGSTGFGAVSIWAVAYASTLRTYVAVAGPDLSGAAKYSYDGYTWFSSTGFSNRLPSTLTTDGSKFICGQSAGVVSYSADGVTWTQPTTGLFVGGSIYTTYGQGVFTAESTNTIAYSSNGTTWTLVTAMPTVVGVLSGIWYAGGFFFTYDSGGGIWASDDAITWKGSLYQPGAVSTIVASGDVFVSGMTSSFISVSRTTKYDLVLAAAAGTLLSAETEDDLTNGWVDFISIVNSSGTIIFSAIPVNSYTSSTRVLNVTSTTSNLSTTEGYYVVFGTYASTHCSLPDVAERYLTDYTALRIQMRDSNSEAPETSAVLGALEEEILAAVANLEEDLVAIPILDSTMLNYADDL